jgi:hypothetical protein
MFSAVLLLNFQQYATLLQTQNSVETIKGKNIMKVSPLTEILGQVIIPEVLNRKLLELAATSVNSK